jgi:hypothetical protein
MGYSWTVEMGEQWRGRDQWAQKWHQLEETTYTLVISFASCKNYIIKKCPLEET